ncbi:hypothetical protein JKF63_00197 [Porcisia hertigi]|uniref:Uncharacterized protein n=1 Tax=Porcisia hertigi TaxID=2761500 RepID=A0A836I950_9TRYP|nr:hypothetical protein JKF63_00197 [Porcisia hertigi]
MSTSTLYGIRGSPRDGTYTSASTSSSSSPSSSHARSPAALSQHVRHAQRIAPLTTGTAAAGSSSTRISPRAMGTAVASPSPADVLRQPSTSAEAMASLTAPAASTRQSTFSWLPTRLTSSYCVLSAAGLQEDFYTSCLSWGTNQMALALQEDLVLFHPSHPRQASSTARISTPPGTREDGDSSSGAAAASAFPGPRRATAVAMTRCQEMSCFLGMSNGAVELYEGRGDGTLQRTVAFAMPPPPTGYLNPLVFGSDNNGVASAISSTSRAARALSLLSSSVSSISCVSTSSRHPWLGSAATAARGLVTLDSRQVQPAIRFGTGAELSQDECARSSSPAAAYGGPSSGSGDFSKLRRAATFLRQHDRLCSVSWNATGSLVATGSGSGIVKVWSLSAPQRPLHTFVVDPDCSVKALCFHPGNPYVLLVGASAGAAGLRTYVLSGAEPVLTITGATAAPVTQALYDPEGNYAVTGAGVPLLPASSSSWSLPYPALAAHGELGSTGGGPGSGFYDNGPARHRSSFSRPNATTAGSALSLHDTWGEEEVSTSRVSDALDLPAGVAGVAASSETSSTVVGHSTPPNALVVWRCGTKRREKFLREALLECGNQRCDSIGGRGSFVSHCGDKDDDGASDDDDGANVLQVDCRDRDGLRDSTVIADGGSRRRSDSGYLRSEWMPMYALPGHRARPLLICAPFPQSSFAGCYASIAGGEDGTIRFWRFFETISDATHWQHRRQAQQQSAMSQEDMDFLATPVLR